jgi:hypothetical protein
MPVIPDEEQLIVQNTVATNLLEIIGTGIDFPFRYVSGNTVGKIIESNAGERIKDSMHLILSTRIGERMFNPEFGSRLPELVFEPNDDILKSLLRIYTVEALRRWEKRIDIVNVVMIDNYNDDRSMVGIYIEYVIRNSHIKGSYVYPFVREGMPTSDLYTGSEQRRMTTAGQVVL